VTRKGGEKNTEGRKEREAVGGAERDIPSGILQHANILGLGTIEAGTERQRGCLDPGIIKSCRDKSVLKNPPKNVSGEGKGRQQMLVPETKARRGKAVPWGRPEDLV